MQRARTHTCMHVSVTGPLLVLGTMTPNKLSKPSPEQQPRLRRRRARARAPTHASAPAGAAASLHRTEGVPDQTCFRSLLPRRPVGACPLLTRNQQTRTYAHASMHDPSRLSLSLSISPRAVVVVAVPSMQILPALCVATPHTAIDLGMAIMGRLEVRRRRTAQHSYSKGNGRTRCHARTPRSSSRPAGDLLCALLETFGCSLGRCVLCV